MGGGGCRWGGRLLLPGWGWGWAWLLPGWAGSAGVGVAARGAVGRQQQQGRQQGGQREGQRWWGRARRRRRRQRPLVVQGQGTWTAPWSLFALCMRRGRRGQRVGRGRRQMGRPCLLLPLLPLLPLLLLLLLLQLRLALALWLGASWAWAATLWLPSFPWPLLGVLAPPLGRRLLAARRRGVSQ